jgi:protein-disulfide isomerase
MSGEYSSLSLSVNRNRDHIQGPDNAPVTLVEYGDYECTYCGQAYLKIKQVQNYFGDSLRFVFRNFPLTQVHPNAQKAAEAAEEAANQNKFWEMHDYLYEHQQALDDKHLEKYAKIVGLNLERFNEDVKNHIHISKIREDFLSGVQSGVNGTPSFYINDIRYDNSWDFDTLTQILTSIIDNNMN